MFSFDALFKDPFQRYSIRQWLALSCAFSIAFLVARCMLTGTLHMSFLIWNLFLAAIPFAISEWLSSRPRFIENRFLLILVLGAWLLFMPNTFYIITDLFHLGNYSGMPKWFDLLMIISFAWNGIVLGLLSLRRIELILTLTMRRHFPVMLVFIVMWLNAFGIYIGRYLRFNSWDVVTRPFTVLEESASLLLHPFQNIVAWSMFCGYAVFMTLLYYMIRTLAKGFHFNPQLLNK